MAQVEPVEAEALMAPIRTVPMSRPNNDELDGAAHGRNVAVGKKLKSHTEVTIQHIKALVWKV